jgi:hypothetical protein
MKFGEACQCTKRDVIVGILVCLAYTIILLGGLWFGYNYLGW